VGTFQVPQLQVKEPLKKVVVGPFRGRSPLDFERTIKIVLPTVGSLIPSGSLKEQFPWIQLRIQLVQPPSGGVIKKRYKPLDSFQWATLRVSRFNLKGGSF
jgi:hypothetical protein